MQMTVTKRNTHHFLPRKLARKPYSLPVLTSRDCPEGQVRVSSPLWPMGPIVREHWEQVFNVRPEQQQPSRICGKSSPLDFYWSLRWSGHIVAQLGGDSSEARVTVMALGGVFSSA